MQSHSLMACKKEKSRTKCAATTHRPTIRLHHSISIKQKALPKYNINSFIWSLTTMITILLQFGKNKSTVKFYNQALHQSHTNTAQYSNQRQWCQQSQRPWSKNLSLWKAAIYSRYPKFLPIIIIVKKKSHDIKHQNYQSKETLSEKKNLHISTKSGVLHIFIKTLKEKGKKGKTEKESSLWLTIQ